MDRDVAVVGFDLDMTLVDSRAGILDTLAALATESGEDALRAPDLLDALLRRNLDLEFADRLPARRAEVLADRFRALYADIGIAGTSRLPGAADAIATVRAAGGRIVVVTAKYEPNAQRCLDHVGLVVDEVHGWRYGPAKAEALVAAAAGVYVGDTPRDMEAARAAGAAAVGVATGLHPADELAAAGADVVLSSLEAFAAWWLPRSSSARGAPAGAGSSSAGPRPGGADPGGAVSGGGATPPRSSP